MYSPEKCSRSQLVHELNKSDCDQRQYKLRSISSVVYTVFILPGHITFLAEAVVRNLQTILLIVFRFGTRFCGGSSKFQRKSCCTFMIELLLKICLTQNKC